MTTTNGPRFEMHVNLETAAMVENAAGEIARVLRDVATDIEDGGLPSEIVGGQIRDANGTNCGVWDIER